MLNMEGILMRKVVPSDNSCLFTSIAFVLGELYLDLTNPHSSNLSHYPKELTPRWVPINSRIIDTTAGYYLRNIITNAIKQDPENYNEAILGKPSHEYCQWISQPDSWGGAIEIAILSQHYGIEISVVHTYNGNIIHFGEDKDYPQRIILFFDRIHYDPLYLEDSAEKMIQTIFYTQDHAILKQAYDLAQETRLSLLNKNVDGYNIRCNHCDRLFKKKEEAQVHARLTGHKNFEEIR